MEEGHHYIPLGSSTLISLLEEVVGQACTVTFRAGGELVELPGRLEGLQGNRWTLRLIPPVGEFAAQQVRIAVSEKQVMFECLVLGGSATAGCLLSYPLWFVGPERRRADRVEVELPCRFSVEAEGTSEWHSGVIKDVSTKGVHLVTGMDLPPQTAFWLRLSIPEHPVPLLLRASSVGSIPGGDAYTVRAEFQDLSVQAEAALLRLMRKSQSVWPGHMEGKG